MEPVILFKTCLSKSTLRIKIGCTVKKLETILVLEGKKKKKKKERKRKKNLMSH